MATLGVELVVLLVVARRFGAASASARSLILPVLVAAALLLAGDVLVPLDAAWLPSWTRNAAEQLTILGKIVVATDLVRFGAIPLLLLVAAGPTARRERLPSGRRARRCHPTRTDVGDHRSRASETR